MEGDKPRIGVLALQGNVREHVSALSACEVETREVKQVGELEGLDGLVLPGGESTTIGRLMAEGGFLPAIQQRVGEGMGLFATCAGMILAATDIAESDQPRLGLLDVRVRRNAFGRQRESFTAPLKIEKLGEKPFPAVFIRGPYIERVGDGVNVLAKWQGKAVLVRQGHILAAAFHPEMSDDPRLHGYFLSMLKSPA